MLAYSSFSPSMTDVTATSGTPWEEKQKDPETFDIFLLRFKMEALFKAIFCWLTAP